MRKLADNMSQMSAEMTIARFAFIHVATNHRTLFVQTLPAVRQRRRKHLTG